MEKIVTLKPIRTSPEWWDEIERLLKEHFKREIYIPLLRELHAKPSKALTNAKKSALWEALRTGKITYSQGVFSGKFSADTSRELKELGAKWHRATSTFRATFAELPFETRNMISATESAFQQKMAKIDKKLAQILPEEIAGRFKIADVFKRVIGKTEKAFQANVKGITLAPKLTEETKDKIAKEWSNNMDLWIKNFTEEEIKELRKNIQSSVFSGNRYGSAISAIQKSYGVSANKAKFLARQETKLLTTKFQEARYGEAGITEYTWHSVIGTPDHPVRPQHKKLADASKAGKIYRYDDPPITSEPGQPARRNNPGQDYNCRCFSRPVVKFKSEKSQ